MTPREEADAEVVYARCRVCEWRSDPWPVHPGQPNAVWHARRFAAREYREHFEDRHRPPPAFDFAALGSPSQVDVETKGDRL